MIYSSLILLLIGALGSHAFPTNHSDDNDTSSDRTRPTVSGMLMVTTSNKPGNLHGIAPAKWSFNYVKPYLVLTLFMFSVALSKIVYNNTNFLSSWMPESCILIILGATVGYLMLATSCSFEKAAENFTSLGNCSHTAPISMTPAFFFLVLVPPIVLESAYNLHDPTFIENVGGIMSFAVFGTVANFLLIGFLVHACGEIGAFLQPQLNLRQALLFSSFIVAVDPIAVLCIFEEIGVDRTLYFLVFGESLLNDAVTVVLYNVMSAFSRIQKVDIVQVILAAVSFFTVSLGGLIIGVIVGALSSVLLKYTENVRVVEPLLMFLTAYLSYLLAELFDWSGIISIIFCGLMQAQYAFHNISHKSYTTVKYFSKTLASVSEAMIFLLLGMELVANYKHDWNVQFIAIAIFVCVLVRFLVVMGVSLVTNQWNSLRKISLTEQFIIAYGGLRGAVAFSLAASLELSDEDVNQKHTFITTTLSIIIFTVFFQGITIKPLVKLLRIRVEGRKQLSLVCEITSHVQDHICAGIEEIIGTHGSHYIKEYLSHADGKYLKPLLQREPQTRDQKIMQIYEKIALRMHFATINTASFSRAQKEDRLSPGLMRSISNRSITTLIDHHPADTGGAQSNLLPKRHASENDTDADIDADNDTVVVVDGEDAGAKQSVSSDKVMQVMRLTSMKRKRRAFKRCDVGESHTEYLRELQQKSITVSKLARIRNMFASLGNSDRDRLSPSTLSPHGGQNSGSSHTQDAAASGDGVGGFGNFLKLPTGKIPPRRQNSIVSLLFGHDDSLLDVNQACIAASVLCAPVLNSADFPSFSDLRLNDKVPDPVPGHVLVPSKTPSMGQAPVLNLMKSRKNKKPPVSSAAAASQSQSQSQSQYQSAAVTGARKNERYRSNSMMPGRLGSVPTIKIEHHRGDTDDDDADATAQKAKRNYAAFTIGDDENSMV